MKRARGSNAGLEPEVYRDMRPNARPFYGLDGVDTHRQAIRDEEEV